MAQDSNERVVAAARHAMLVLRPPASGVLVDWARDGESASRAGLKKGDLVIGLNGKSAPSRDDLRADLPAGSKLSVLRGGSVVTIEVSGRLNGLRARSVERK